MQQHYPFLHTLLVVFVYPQAMSLQHWVFAFAGQKKIVLLICWVPTHLALDILLTVTQTHPTPPHVLLYHLETCCISQ